MCCAKVTFRDLANGDAFQYGEPGVLPFRGVKISATQCFVLDGTFAMAVMNFKPRLSVIRVGRIATASEGVIYRY